ncbi:hypothetical protein PRIPAC_70627 [Pristionchus pacificus]|uniref:G protein-coupled receptor n=1 Tax=Pristionchus pacificus TaxID=54126 RepID=A0A2A6BZK0_PRIPA|nr:hypothetical protein PRIPAC_70627 [Pristionchus pacificus]|eukprot:PDM71374.1 G protein-coupled receptor [Pristionchus pacificus]
MSAVEERFEYSLDQLSIPAFFTLRERADDRLLVGLMLIPITYGILANVALIFTVKGNKEIIANPSYYLLVHIAVCDLAILLFELSFRMGGIVFRQAYLGSAYSPLNYTIHFFRQCAWWSFVFELTLTAVNRFVCICFIGRYDKLFTHRSMLLAVIIISILGVLMSTPHLFPCCRVMFFFDIWTSAYYPSDTWYLQFDYVVTIITIGIITTSYLGVCWRVRQKRVATSGKKRRQQVHIALQVGLMSGIYILNCLTWNIVPYIKATRLTNGIYFSLNSLQCASHPTIAFLLNGRIRAALIRAASSRSQQRASTGSSPTLTRKNGVYRVESRPNQTDTLR